MKNTKKNIERRRSVNRIKVYWCVLTCGMYIVKADEKEYDGIVQESYC